MSIEQATVLTCLACGTHWLSATRTTNRGTSRTLCPDCHIPCTHCNQPIPTKRALKLHTRGTPTTHMTCNNCGAA